MTACYCEIENPASVYRATRPIARTPHRCDECGGQIAARDRYERVDGLWDGGWSTYRTCSGCLMLRDHLTATRPCWCWYHGHLVEDIEDELREAMDWQPGERFRAIALYAQWWRERVVA